MSLAEFRRRQDIIQRSVGFALAVCAMLPCIDQQPPEHLDYPIGLVPMSGTATGTDCGYAVANTTVDRVEVLPPTLPWWVSGTAVPSG